MKHVSRMFPSPGEHLLRFVGDRLRVTLEPGSGVGPARRAFLRTNLTRARAARREVIASAGQRGEDSLTFAGASWRDIPLAREGESWFVDLPLLEVGHFRAKAYWLDEQNHQHWPDGSDVGISVHPDRLRTANLIYCTFPRTMGREELRATPASLRGAVRELDERGFTVIPPSGTLRNLIRELPHIFDTLGCRILHLLPIGPVPTTHARMGRYGSPYAQLDLTSIDPAFVEFDRRTTAVDQFLELTDGVHLRDGLVFLDIVLNHTGWASRLMEQHPEWFRREADGHFHSPGAWGVIWADLVELDQRHAALWEELAQALLVWCRRGVDGFRCDAGYMVPLPAWQYVVARVRSEFPECVFLLEGLGGAWEATESLLTQGGMQWAYSELFQCYEPRHVAHYLDHALKQAERIGVLAHYSETHDNDRLAKRGVTWSLMRNRLCALGSQCGAYGFNAGVEWLCTDKFDVHEAHSLGWGNSPNLLAELKRLNTLLASHPCFFDGARVERVSADDSAILALHRRSADERDHCLVLVNLLPEQRAELTLSAAVWQRGGEKRFDLLGQVPPAPEWLPDGSVRLSFAPGQSFCLAASSEPAGLSGQTYRLRRAQAAWAYSQLGACLPHEAIGPADFEQLARFAAEDPLHFLAAASALTPEDARVDLLAALRKARLRGGYAEVVLFTAADASRITQIPPRHWLLLRDEQPFEVSLRTAGRVVTLRSTRMEQGHVAALPPHAGEREEDVQLTLDRFGDPGRITEARLRRLATLPEPRTRVERGLALLTNGRGAMARLSAEFGAVSSKYDCLLAANLHPDVPSERHVLVKRARAWVNANGFITALDGDNLTCFEAGPPAVWSFAANAGDGQRVGVRITLGFVPERNTVVARVERIPSAARELAAELEVSVTMRFDLEDRSMHGETQATPELEQRFVRATRTLEARPGFAFAPAHDRQVRVFSDAGSYHAGVEWTRDILHPIEQERGLLARGDTYSPGWFELPLTTAAPLTLVVDAEPHEDSAQARAEALRPVAQSEPSGGDPFERELRRATRAFVVRRGRGKTVIAGYPWFLDWGRDTFIAARGLIAAGYHEDVRRMLLTYAAFERGGTLPNYLAGEGEGSRETSDAPLWFALACEELADELGAQLYEERAEDGRSLREVLRSLADNHLLGTHHGVVVDVESGLVWSPSHFTWMDTNYPAATPREGYPIELSVLFARLLRQLVRIGEPGRADYAALAERTEASLAGYYRPELGYCADTLHASRGVPAALARADDHLRPNQLLAVSLGSIRGEAARSIVHAAERHLLVPGALRSLAPLRVTYGLPVRGADGTLLNDGARPYWPRYEGDEDTRRKPAYHNGTAWCWWLPTYCEALVHAYPGDSAALAAARAVLGASARLLGEGCVGHLPEILDGDAPHTQRGCDAQAWSVTEALRVWLWLAARSRKQP